jgi:hypothetical protein
MNDQFSLLLILTRSKPQEVHAACAIAIIFLRGKKSI